MGVEFVSLDRLGDDDIKMIVPLGAKIIPYPVVPVVTAAQPSG